MMMMSAPPAASGNYGSGAGQAVSVPPGFRFHPTDEELLHYYLRKKVAYEVIDLDVIRDVDLNKLEPWDLKDKCRIGSGPQNEWYFFSHKDKKYPTGTRTNRATNAGFWKATGRDKAIHLMISTTTTTANNVVDASSSYRSSNNNINNKRIGMRKTLVFYTGRAPHGQKTDWIMHEYRLEQENDNHHHLLNSDHIQLHEDGWVVCRVFKKKNHQRVGSYQQQQQQQQQPTIDHHHHHHHHHQVLEADDQTEQHFSLPHMKQKPGSSTAAPVAVNNINNILPLLMDHDDDIEPMSTKRRQLFPQYDQQQNSFDCSMHLPQLLSPEQSVATTTTTTPPPISFLQPIDNNINEYCSSHHQNLMKLLTSNMVGGGGGQLIQQETVENSSCGGNSCNYKFNASAAGASDWSFLDKLLVASHQNQLDQYYCQTKCNPPSAAVMSMQVVHDNVGVPSRQTKKFPFHHHDHHQYHGNYETNASKFSNK